MKKIFALVLAVLLLAALAPAALCADSATVYFSVSVDGKLQVAAKPVTVSTLTVDAVLKEAHKAYFKDGEKGYAAATDKTWNMYLISKAWGVATTPYVIINNAPLGADSSQPTTVDKFPVKTGDNIIMCIITDQKSTAKPTSMTAKVSGSNVTITATAWTLDFSTFTYKSAAAASAKVVDPETGKSLGTTDSKGSATVAIPDSGIVAIDGLAAIHVADKKAAPAPADTSSGEAKKPTVMLSKQVVKVDGVEKSFEAYNIDGSNYFKLRDIAYVLNGTAAQFSVTYDAATKTIACKTGEAYTAVGGEMTIGSDKSSTAQASSQSITINGKAASLTAYNIGGSNFIKLRDMGTALGFNVGYDDATKTVLITTK